MTASEPITVTISHSLGRDEAKRRIERAIDAIRGEIARFVRSFDYGWDGYRLEFRAVVLAQTIVGRLDVFEEFVRVELVLPRLLHRIAKTLTGRIERRGTALLEGPKQG